MFKNDTHLFSNIHFVYSAVWKYARVLLIILLPSCIVSTFGQYISSFFLRSVIDSFSVTGTFYGLLKTAILYFLVLTSLSLCGIFFNSFSYLFTKVRYKMIIEKNAKVMSIPYEMLESPEILDCYQKATTATFNDSHGIEGFITSGFSLFSTFISAIIGLFFVEKINIYAVMVIFLVVLIEFLVMNKLNKDCKIKLWNPLSPIIRKTEYLGNVATDFSYAKEIRMFRLSDWLMRKYKKLSEQRLNVFKKNAKVWNWYSVFSNGLWLITQILVYSWLLHLIIIKSITIGEFTFFLSATAIFFHNLSGLFSEFANFLQKSREVNDFRIFMNINTDIDSNKTAVPNYTCWKFEFRNVSFKYPSSDSDALKNINLVINDKEKLALVGLNGAGKSTFIKLLLGLYSPTEGEILLNGQNIHNFKKESYFKSFSTVFQEKKIFALPLWQNVSLKNGDESDFQQVNRSLEKAGLSDKTNCLQDGIETELLRIITDKGINLSGGETQKLVAARAIYKDAPCFILDEPDSALDAFSEKHLYENISEVTKNKTTVLISHRLESVNICDKIAVFENGQIIEYGTKDEVLKMKGSFSKMWEKISEQYKSESENFVDEF